MNLNHSMIIIITKITSDFQGGYKTRNVGGMEYGMERQSVKTNQEARQEEIKEQGTLA